MNNKTAKNASPKGWRWVRLGDISDIISGQSPTSDTYRKKPEGLPFYQGKTDFGLRNPTARVWCVAPKKIAMPGDILISVRAPVGPTNVADVECCIGRGLAIIRCKKNVNTHFVLSFLKLTERKISQISAGGVFDSINRNDLLNFQILLPPLAEQRTIASLLEKWDMATEKIEELIVAKEKQFKWLLKTLIGGQQNNSEWRKLKLGEVCKINKGEQLGRLQMIKNGRYSVQNGGISPSGNTDKWNTPANTVTINEGGNCGYVNLMTSKFWAGAHCYTLANLIREIDVGFLYYVLKERERFLMKLQVGSALPNIQKGDIENFSLFFPSLVVQKRINWILNRGSREIDLLRQLVRQYRKQRDGLARKLLMGEWRVQT